MQIMSDKNTNINYKNYFEFVETLLKIEKLSDFLLAFIDFAIPNINFIETAIYLYNADNRLEDIIKNNQSSIISNNIDQLVEGGIFEWIRNTKQIAVLPNLSDLSDLTQNIYGQATSNSSEQKQQNLNFLLIPFFAKGKMFGLSITLTDMNREALEEKFDLINNFSEVFAYFLYQEIKSDKKEVVFYDKNSNEIVSLILQNIYNSNKILFANITLLNNNIGNAEDRQAIINSNIENINNLNRLYNKYKDDNLSKISLNDLFSDIHSIDKDFLNDNNIHLNINFLEKDIEINRDVNIYALLFLKIINLIKNKDVNKRIINIKIIRNKIIQFKSYFSLLIDDNSVYFPKIEDQFNPLDTDNPQLSEIISLVNELKGKINIESNFEMGTVYHLHFPI